MVFPSPAPNFLSAPILNRSLPPVSSVCWENALPQLSPEPIIAGLISDRQGGSMASLPSPVLPACWAEILENVQKALAQAESEAARSAQALDSALESAPRDDGGWQG